jgi:Outer membrane protein beta-barrel domain
MERLHLWLKKLVTLSFVHVLAALLGIFVIAVPAKAQNVTPKIEVYGGYNYVRVSDLGDSYNFNGGSGQFAYNANRWLGLVGDFGGYYTSDGFHAGVLSYMAGPRVNFRGHGKMTPFAQILLGGARSIDDSPLNAFAMTVGGGLDYKISQHFAIRPVQAEYFLTKFSDGASDRQNNFRYGAGVVFQFGTR